MYLCSANHQIEQIKINIIIIADNEKDTIDGCNHHYGYNEC
jgi:hypothetical protein